MTIEIFGDYFDCNVYRNKLYLWDMYGNLSIYDWDALFPKSLDVHVITDEKLREHLVGTTSILGGIFPFKTEFYENHLYSAMQDGLFMRYLPKGNKLRNISRGKPKCLIDETIQSFSIDIDGDIYAEGKESFFYIQNPRAKELTHSGTQKYVEYKEQKAQSNNAIALMKSLPSNDNKNKDLPSLFHNRGLMFRDYAEDEELYWLAGTYFCRFRNNRIEELTDIDKVVNSFELNLPEKITGELFRAGYGSFGHILDFNDQLVIVNKNGTNIYIIDFPVTNWHVLRNIIKGRDVLVSVHDDRVFFTDVEEVFKKGLPPAGHHSDTD